MCMVEGSSIPKIVFQQAYIFIFLHCSPYDSPPRKKRLGEVSELVCMTHGCELRWGNDGGRGQYRTEGNKGEKKNGTTVIA